MALYKTDGTQLTKTSIESLVTEVTETDPWVKVNAPIYKGKVPDGTVYPEAQRMLLYKTGDRVRRSVLASHFPAATITSVSPATGPAAGGTRVTVRGKGFTPGATLTSGGTNGVNVKVIDDGLLEFTTPAHAAGAGDIVVTTDAGPVTKANAFTWA